MPHQESEDSYSQRHDRKHLYSMFVGGPAKVKDCLLVEAPDAEYETPDPVCLLQLMGDNPIIFDMRPAGSKPWETWLDELEEL